MTNTEGLILDALRHIDEIICQAIGWQMTLPLTRDSHAALHLLDYLTDRFVRSNSDMSFNYPTLLDTGDGWAVTLLDWQDLLDFESSLDENDAWFEYADALSNTAFGRNLPEAIASLALKLLKLESITIP